MMITAEKRAKVLLCFNTPEKCHSDEIFGEIQRVERGKPLERRTQIFGRGASRTENEPSVGTVSLRYDR